MSVLGEVIRSLIQERRGLVDSLAIDSLKDKYLVMVSSLVSDYVAKNDLGRVSYVDYHDFVGELVVLVRIDFNLDTVSDSLISDMFKISKEINSRVVDFISSNIRNSVIDRDLSRFLNYNLDKGELNLSFSLEYEKII